MVRRCRRPSRLVPAWRISGAAIGGFAIGLQLLLSAFLVGHVAVAADQSDFAVICSHDPATSEPAAPAAPASHDQCPACAFPQSAAHLAPPPAAPSHAVVLPRAQSLLVAAAHVPDEHDFHTPYASRAPPRSA